MDRYSSTVVISEVLEVSFCSPCYCCWLLEFCVAHNAAAAEASWGGGKWVCALRIIASKLNLAEHDNWQDALHDQMFVETWILRPYGMFDTVVIASSLVWKLWISHTRICSYSALSIRHWALMWRDKVWMEVSIILRHTSNISFWLINAVATRWQCRSRRTSSETSVNAGKFPTADAAQP